MITVRLLFPRKCLNFIAEDSALHKYTVVALMLQNGIEIGQKDSELTQFDTP